MDNKTFWDGIYKGKKESKPIYDLWLDEYEGILKKSDMQYIIDLGCGAGGDTLYLTEKGYKVIACDCSEEGLKILNNFLPYVKTIQMDISQPLPFKNESAYVIIADLSLHYFNQETTKNIINEIKRVLRSNGYLIGRVNSINDLNYGAGRGQEIEKNFYLTQEGYKRFFCYDDIKAYFKDFEIEKCAEKSVAKYGNEKKVIEFVVKKVD